MLQRLAKTAALMLAALVLFMAGCGGDDDPYIPPAEPAESDAPTDGDEEGAITGYRMKPVKAKETLAEGVERMQEVAETGDCEEIVALFALTRESADVAADCEFLRQALARQVVAIEEFGGGGVIDLVTDEGMGSSAVTILDADGRFHIAFVDGFLGGNSVGSEAPIEEFDAAAQAALDALDAKDCAAFVEIAHHRFGAGSSPDEAATCAYVDASLVPSILDQNPKAKLRSLGANEDYALYGLETPDANLTMVIARQLDPEVLPEGLEQLPEGAPDLAFVEIYPTFTASKKD